MFKIKSKILKKLSAGFMAGLCVFSMLGSSMSGVITANAASTSTENSAFPSADTVVAKAATLLGSPYTFGNKGYWYAYNQGQYTPLSVQTINNLGIDCSGLVYYTLTQTRTVDTEVVDRLHRQRSILSLIVCVPVSFVSKGIRRAEQGCRFCDHRICRRECCVFSR